MSVYKIFILLIFNRECMERNVMTSFRILSSFECFLRCFQKDWSVFFTFQCKLFTNCIFSNNASLVSARTGGGGGGQPNMDRPGQKYGGPTNSQICPDIFMDDSYLQKQLFVGVFQSRFLKNFTIFTEKRLCRSLSFIKFQVWRPTTLTKSDSYTGAFLWILQNF